MSYTSNTSVMFYVTETGNVSFKVCLFMLGIWFCCLFKITWLHSEDFVTPSWHRWKNNFAFQLFLLVFSFTNACLMWLFFWHLLYSVKWQIERFVKAGCLCAFFFFLSFIYLCQCLNHCYSMVNAYVHHEVTMFICPFSLKMFCIQLCQFATMVQIDSIYITMSACCGWLQSGKARFGLSCCDGMRFF